MEAADRRLAMTKEGSGELDRQYRVAKQTVAMHSYLRDAYSFRTVAMRCVLLAGSAVFCATAFAGDDLFTWIGVTPASGRNLLRIASVTCFVISILMLLLGWEAAAARHGDAVKRFSAVVAQFRDHFDKPNRAEAQSPFDLNSAYWEACHQSTPIPNRLHSSLKARYLLNIEVNRILDKVPGCPPFVVRWVLLSRGVKRGITAASEFKFDTACKAKLSPEGTSPP